MSVFRQPLLQFLWFAIEQQWSGMELGDFTVRFHGLNSRK
jgi:hypothetical protein